MSDEIEYLIPEEYQAMARHAGPLALRLQQRLTGRSEDSCTTSFTVCDPGLFVVQSAERLEDQILDVASAVNALNDCISSDDVASAMEEVEDALMRILDDMDEVRRSPFLEDEDGKLLLVSVMGRFVHAVAVMFQRLHLIVLCPEQFIDEDEENVHFDLSIEFDFAEEARPLVVWADRIRRINNPASPDNDNPASFDHVACIGLGTVAVAFGLGWLLGDE